jgi:hypothetical protein
MNGVSVRPTADEIAAVLAALAQRGAGPTTSPYERWRLTRLAARATARDGDVQPRG